MTYKYHDKGTFTDTTTGLMWQVNEDGEKKKYGEALMYCQMLDLGGYDDWRVPTKEELQRLVHPGFEILKQIFPGLQEERYWASSPEDELYWAENSGKIAYTIDFDPGSSNYGRAITYYRTYSYFVRAVRDLIGKKAKKEDEPSISAPVQQKQEKSTSSGLLEYLDKCEGTDELYEMLRTRSVSDIEDVCRTFPIDTLRLDWDSIQRDFRMSKRFELITVLAQILIRYDEILTTTPELRLPGSLPAKRFAEILMSRLMPFISTQHVEVAESLKIRLYDFAMALMQSDRNEDALVSLLASRPSTKEDHEFWVFACRHNIATSTKKPEDISAAISSGDAIISGKVKVPEDKVQGTKQLMNKLKELN